MTTETYEHIHLPFPIVTERLTLRPVTVADAPSLFEAKTESFKELNRWMPWAKEPGTLEKDIEMLTEQEGKLARREDIMVVGHRNDTNRLVIATGLHQPNWEARVFEIGYWVRTSEAGQGFATESTAALIRYAFNALSATKIKIAHAGGNDASARVIEKLGFEKEGVFQREELLPDGTPKDVHWYARFDAEGLPACILQW